MTWVPKQTGCCAAGGSSCFDCQPSATRGRRDSSNQLSVHLHAAAQDRQLSTDLPVSSCVSACSQVETTYPLPCLVVALTCACVSRALLFFAAHVPRAPSSLFGCYSPPPQQLMARQPPPYSGDLAARAQVAREAADESNQVRVPKETKEWGETGWWKCEGPQPELIPGGAGLMCHCSEGI